LEQLGIQFTAISAEVDETFPEGLTADDAAKHIAEKKALHFESILEDPKNILITADTLVVLDGRILGKPDNADQAIQMLKDLSGKVHQVITGICLRSQVKSRSFTARTDVRFKELSDQEINYYVENYMPFDKAGAYGIQEWIGYIGVTHIEGSYFNVVGLPVQKLYEELLSF
jgi:septum formation protein